jgi:hypothetical protein
MSKFKPEIEQTPSGTVPTSKSLPVMFKIDKEVKDCNSKGTDPVNSFE